MADKKIQYSKLLPILSLAVLCWCLYEGYKTDFTQIMDVSFYISSITIVGSLTITSWVWYLKKAQAENIYKIKLGLYREVADVRVTYNKEMANIVVGDEAPLDSLEDDALNELTRSVDDAMSETERIEREEC